MLRLCKVCDTKIKEKYRKGYYCRTCPREYCSEICGWKDILLNFHVIKCDYLGLNTKYKDL